jgi:hypothetical protein
MHFCGGFLVALGYSHHFSHQPCLPQAFTILTLICLDHYPQLRLMTRQPTHQLSQLIILILQTINIMCKFQILQSMQFTGRARSRNRFFQLSLKRNSIACISSIFPCKTGQEVQAPSKAGLHLSSATSTISTSISSHLEACFSLNIDQLEK